MGRRFRRRPLRFDPEYAVISCYPEGNRFRCLVLGLESLSVCEGTTQEDHEPKEIIPKEKIYIRRCGVELTDAEKEILLEILKDYVRKHEDFYLMIVNYSGMYTKTIHVLELLPGIGRATRKKIESLRPFKSLDEVKEKVKVDIVESLAKRILAEILGEAHEKIFSRRPRTGS